VALQLFEKRFLGLRFVNLWTNLGFPVVCCSRKFLRWTGHTGCPQLAAELGSQSSPQIRAAPLGLEFGSEQDAIL
jgi:hypothetical protein